MPGNQIQMSGNGPASNVMYTAHGPKVLAAGTIHIILIVNTVCVNLAPLIILQQNGNTVASVDTTSFITPCTLDFITTCNIGDVFTPYMYFGSAGNAISVYQATLTITDV